MHKRNAQDAPAGKQKGTDGNNCSHIVILLIFCDIRLLFVEMFATQMLCHHSFTSCWLFLFFFRSLL